jgi:hypothetical protein
MDYEAAKKLLDDVERRVDARITGNGDLLDAAERMYMRCISLQADLLHVTAMVKDAFHEGETTPVLDVEAWSLSGVRTRVNAVRKRQKLGDLL